MRARRLLGAVAALAAAGGLLSSCAGSGSGYTFSAVFANGQGVFPGSHVQILGLTVGSVTAVRNEGDHVVVTMNLPSAHPVPSSVRAIVVAPELLGQRSVDLEPGYTGGPRLQPGAVIPESRTSVPVETNTILNEFTNYLQQINPSNVHDAVANLAQILDGQGQALNDLIGHAAGTISLLADKGNQLGQLNGSLAQLTGTLDSRTSDIEALIRDYDTVSGVIATDRQQLDAAVSSLAAASQQLAGLLTPNLSGIQQDLNVLTTTGRTIDRNLDSVDTGLSASVKLFAAANRAYDPTRRWLNLNNQSPPNTPSMVVADEVRDRLAGICRRVLAHHSQGLPPAEIQTLQKCGDPASGYFDPILGQITGILNGVSGAQSGGPTLTPQQALSQGVAKIPGLTPQQQSTLSQGTLPTPASTPNSPSTPSSPPSTLLPPLPALPSASASPGVFATFVGAFASAGHHVFSFIGGML
ncbi:MAG TPA: MCE family protein [Acidimicrobiales bacterium]|nr:MCE family protein [Acidimicrobiales bacterium]